MMNMIIDEAAIPRAAHFNFMAPTTSNKTVVSKKRNMC